MHYTSTSSSDFEEENFSMDKHLYTLLFQYQDEITNCTKLLRISENNYPESYYKVVRCLDNIGEIPKRYQVQNNMIGLFLEFCSIKRSSTSLIKLQATIQNQFTHSFVHLINSQLSLSIYTCQRY
jgi:hypothetical protein